MAYEKYTVKQFEDALFNKDRSVISDEEFKIVYSEYIDTAELFDSEEFTKVSYIHYLNNRINSVKIALRLQREFLNNFGVPNVPEFKFLKKFGHNLFWDGNETRFEESLKRIESKEFKYMSELEVCIKRLVDSRLKKNNKDTSEVLRRESFVRTIISLGKIGYRIDKFVTTVEELAFMIKLQLEELKEVKNRK